MRPIMRNWAAHCQYPGRAPFYFGTFEAESELEAVRGFEKAWSKISPHPAPTNVSVVPGMVIFLSEDGE